ncbi:MAG: hypothetical protein KDA05_00695 [Phycisphaerales bacterium]|nr:hypothetical protein [Phycisphaerales bacterium]
MLSPLAHRASTWIAQGGAAPPTSSSPPPPTTPTEIALIALGVAILAIGLWLLARARKTPADAACDPPLPLIGPARRPTLFTLGMGGIILGYHIAAWGVPRWLPLHVPLPMWWALAAGLALAITGSLVSERLERDRPS